MSTVLTDEEAVRRYQEATARLAPLKEESIRLGAVVEQARAELARLEAEAIAEFGTADLAALQQMLRALREENTAAVEQIEAAVGEMETSVKQLRDLKATLEA